MSVHARAHRDAAEAKAFAAAAAGDHDAFRRLTEPYAREIHFHCYRMLGSVQDAEDGLQETLLRAWRHLTSFEGRSSFRAWLYRIATNVCLRQRAQRPRDPVTGSEAIEAIAPTMSPAFNLSPYPDALLDELVEPFGDPGTAYDRYESVQLAFLALVQLLPARQRAVLILHDVLGFAAAEVAAQLDATTASVNSALNRARATMRQHRTTGRLRTLRSVPADQAESFVARCVAAWQAADMAQLSALLTADVVMGMPTLGLRLRSRAAVCEFLARVPAREQRDTFRFIATRANRQPALAVYRRDPDGKTEAYRALAVVVLTANVGGVCGIAIFPDPSLFGVFQLPMQPPTS
jgi:RNA polymerase sigma-70 factor (ECF subfamily)